MKNILVTGGSGFIGLHLAEHLAKLGKQVVILDRIIPEILPGGISKLKGDILDSRLVDEAVQQADIVVHAAGVLGTHETVADPALTVRENVMGSLTLMDAAARYKKPILCISKPNVWLNPYSISKDSMEKFCFMYAKEYGAEIAVLKLFNVYGPRQKYRRVQKAIPTWIVQMLREEQLDVFGSGLATMDLIHVDDVSRGVVAVMDNFEACRLKVPDLVASDVHSSFPELEAQVLQLGSGQETSVLDTIDAIGKELGVPYGINFLPMRRGEVDRTRLRSDNSRLSELTGFEPRIALREGLAQTIAHYRDHLAAVLAHG